MSTIQLAIQNQRYSAALAVLLRQDGSHHVAVVEKPDLDLEGIIVMDGSRVENLFLFQAEPERFVVIARKDAAFLSRVWDAGVRHVVFEEDSPTTALLAVIAAELRMPHQRQSKSAASPVLAGDHERLQPRFPVPILDWQPTACRCSSKIRKTPL